MAGSEAGPSLQNQPCEFTFHLSILNLYLRHHTMHMKTTIPRILNSFLFIAMLVSICCAQNQNSAPSTLPFFQTITGNWRADNGKSFGMKSTVTLECSAILGGKFTRFEYLIIMHPDSVTTQQFSGTGHYRTLSDSTCDGVWCDSEGSMLPLRGTSTANMLSIHWRDSTSRQGRTIYQLQSPDSLLIIDSSLSKQGVMREFSRNILIRR
jgi:hypothetical protein